MADESGLSPYVFSCEGGLVLDRSTFSMQPGMALELENFEPDTKGGYRRINGYTKWNSNIVPQTASDTEPVLMSAYFNGKVIAARGTSVYEAGTTGSWTSIDSGRTSAEKYRFFRYNIAGTDYIVWVDGANNATKYDGTTVTDLNATGAPADPSIVTGFKNALFFAGMSSNPQELVFTAPYTDDDFSIANGAGSIAVDSPITGLVPFREILYIFCEERIFRLVGNSAADFALQPVTREIGCLNGDTIQEFAGDIIFLGPDGLRLFSATDRIGDFGLAVISKPIQAEILDLISSSADGFSSTVIREKSQYRLFGFNSSYTNDAAKAIAGTQLQEGIAWNDLRGFNAYVTFSEYDGFSERIYFSASDGYVYQMEQGNTLDGTDIPATFATPFVPLNDPELRKTIYKATTYLDVNGSFELEFSLKFDFDQPGSVQPDSVLSSDAAASITYGSGIFGTSLYGVKQKAIYDVQTVGSGFHVSLLYETTGTNTDAVFTIDAATLQFITNSRR